MIAVIGHGRSPEGRAWGQRIDACDLVYRLWDWQWQPRSDYGVKYDYGYFTAHQTFVTALLRFNSAIPAKGWIGQEVCVSLRLRGDGPPMSLPERCQIFNDQRWADLGRAMGGEGDGSRYCLSRGTATACFAAEHASLGSTIILVGFDNVRSRRCLPLDEAFPPRYRGNPGSLTMGAYSGTGTKDGPHDFAIEGRIIETVASERGVHIAHAQDLW